jgi:AraC family transcriptional regulator, regulatory protein of adaptative response / methylated-DNA-[protein]-cysteine methyltransferase
MQKGLIGMNSASTGYLHYSNGTVELKVAGASYGAGGTGARVKYTIAKSKVGAILVATTDGGICWVGIHESIDHLESELRKDFPKATLARDNELMGELAAKVVGFINGTAGSLDVPLDIRATPFQLAVWRELCVIPSGRTRSYSEIARRLGQPGSARAVGHANGSNPLAILIPCHRAIGVNGKLTGYRWGLEFKRRLLEHERQLCRG